MNGSPELPALIGVVLAGKDERSLDRRPVDLDGGLVGALLDDGEEVAEQPPFGPGQIGADDRRMRLGVGDGIDRNPLGGRVRAVARRRGGGGQGGSVRGSVAIPRGYPRSAGATGVRWVSSRRRMLWRSASRRCSCQEYSAS